MNYNSKRLAEELRNLTDEYATIRARLKSVKISEIIAHDNLETAKAKAFMSGEIIGKNVEERNAQLRLVTSETQCNYTKARQNTIDVESDLAIVERELRTCEKLIALEMAFGEPHKVYLPSENNYRGPYPKPL